MKSPCRNSQILCRRSSGLFSKQLKSLLKSDFCQKHRTSRGIRIYPKQNLTHQFLPPKSPSPRRSSSSFHRAHRPQKAALSPSRTSNLSTMSLFGGLFGNRSSQPPQPEQSSSADLFNSTTFGSTSGPSDALPPSSSFPLEAPTAFETFATSFDAAKLHPLAGLGDKLDFLQLDEDKLTDVQGAASVLPSRGWTDDLCVGTGTTYLSGGCG